MVATCGGVFFGVAPLVAVAAGVVWLIVFLALRYASLASMAGGIALPVFAYLLGYPTSVVLFGAAAAAAILLGPTVRTWRGCGRAPSAASTSAAGAVAS